MHLSIATWNIEASSMETKLALSRELGFDTVALLSSVPPPDMSPDDPDLQLLMARYGMSAVVHGAVGDCASEEQPAAVRAEIEAVARFHSQHGGIKVMSFDPGYHVTADNRRVYDDEGSARSLEMALEVLAPLGIQVGIENWVINCAMGHFERLHARLGDPALGLLLDLGHLNIAHRSGLLETHMPADFVAASPLPIWEIHVHDNDGASDRHWPLGEGNVDVDTIAQALLRRGFDGYVTLEVILLDARSPASHRDIRSTRDRIASALNLRP
jgi:sugar phosphate isomerase/epimerase